MNIKILSPSNSNEFDKATNKPNSFVDINNCGNEKESQRQNVQDIPQLLRPHLSKNSIKNGLSVFKHVNHLKNRVSIQQICPKTEGNEEDDKLVEEELKQFKKNKSEFETKKLDRQRSCGFELKRAQTKNVSWFQQHLEGDRNSKVQYLNQRQQSLNMNYLQISNNDQSINGVNQTQKSERKNQQNISELTAEQKENARNNLKRILRKALVLNNATKVFASMIQAKYIQRKTESLFDPRKQQSKNEQQKAKYVDDILQKKGIFSGEYLDQQSEFIKALLKLPIHLQNPIHSEVKNNFYYKSQLIRRNIKQQIATTLLKKKLKSSLEMQYLSRCLMNLELFKSNQNMLEDSKSQKIIFSEINYVFFPKNSIIFNFGKIFQLQLILNQLYVKLIGEYGYHYYVMLKGKVYCFIPKPDKKEKMLNEQIEIERQAMKSKTTVPNLQLQVQPRQINELQYLQSPVLSKRVSSASSKNENQQNSPEKQLQSSRNIRKSFIGADKSEQQNQSMKQGASKFQNFKNTDANDDSFENDTSIIESVDDPLSQEPQLKGRISVIKRKNTKDYSKPKKNINEPIEPLNEDQIFQQTYFPDMNLVKIYQPGEAFGEIALMTKERRTASLVCKEDTHLMVLSKEGFQNILGSYQQSMTRQKVLFLKSFSFFEAIANSQLMSLLHQFDVRQFSQKSVIYTENDLVNQVFFIKSGEVQIQKLVYVDSVQLPQTTSEMNTIHENDTSQLFNKNVQTKGKNQQRKTISIKILGPSQYFGQDEILSKQTKRQFRAIALQQSEIYVIQKRDLFAFLKQYKQMDLFIQQNDLKQQWQKTREEEATQLASIRRETVTSSANQQSSIETKTLNNNSNRQQQQPFNPSFYIDKIKNMKPEKLAKIINNINSPQSNFSSIPNSPNQLQRQSSMNNPDYLDLDYIPQSEIVSPYQQKNKFNYFVSNQYAQNSPNSQSNYTPQNNYYKTEESFSKSILKDNTFDNEYSLTQNSPSSTKRKLQQIQDLRICRTVEDEEERISPKKKKLLSTQLESLNLKKQTSEKISNIQILDNSGLEMQSSHIFQLQQFQKINNQKQEIMKEIQKQRIINNNSLEKLQSKGSSRGLGFFMPSEQNNSKAKREHKMQNNQQYKQFIVNQSLSTTTQRYDLKKSMSLERNENQQQENSPSCNIFKIRQKKLSQKSDLNSRSFSKGYIDHNFDKKLNETHDQLDKSKDYSSRNIKDSNRSIQDSQRNINIDTKQDYFVIQQIQQIQNKLNEKIDKKHKNKSLNISNSNYSFDLNSKSTDNSPLFNFYSKFDDVKEDREIQDDEDSINMSLSQKQIPEKKKKLNFISQFFQNNEIAKNKSIQKIIKYQQKNQYIFKQIYTQNGYKSDRSINTNSLIQNN